MLLVPRATRSIIDRWLICGGRSREVSGFEALDCHCKPQDRPASTLKMSSSGTFKGGRRRARHDPCGAGRHDRWPSSTCQSIVSYSTFCAWRLSRSASLKRVDAPPTGLGSWCVHPDHRPMLVRQGADGCERRLPGRAAPALNHRGNVGGVSLWPSPRIAQPLACCRPPRTTSAN